MQIIIVFIKLHVINIGNLAKIHKNHVDFKFASNEHVYSLAIGIQIQFERHIIFSSLHKNHVHVCSPCS